MDKQICERLAVEGQAILVEQGVELPQEDSEFKALVLGIVGAMARTDSATRELKAIALQCEKS